MGVLPQNELSIFDTLSVNEVASSINRDLLPRNYDVRLKWPLCKSVTEIRDQSNCGSCWVCNIVKCAQTLFVLPYYCYLYNHIFTIHIIILL